MTLFEPDQDLLNKTMHLRYSFRNLLHELQRK